MNEKLARNYIYKARICFTERFFISKNKWNVTRIGRAILVVYFFLPTLYTVPTVFVAKSSRKIKIETHIFLKIYVKEERETYVKALFSKSKFLWIRLPFPNICWGGMVIFNFVFILNYLTQYIFQLIIQL